MTICRRPMNASAPIHLHHLCTVLAMLLFFFFNDTATTEIYTLSLHDALPIFQHDAPGTERHAPRQRREPHPWRGLGAAVRGPVAGGSSRGQPGGLRDQRRARADVPAPDLDGLLRPRAGTGMARAAARPGILERARARAGRALLGDGAGSQGAHAGERARAAAARVRAQGPE